MDSFLHHSKINAKQILTLYFLKGSFTAEARSNYSANFDREQQGLPSKFAVSASNRRWFLLSVHDMGKM
jgi:hypothetical protein